MGDSKRELWAAVASGRHAPTGLEAAEDDLDPVWSLVSVFVVVHGRLAALSTGEKARIPLCFNASVNKSVS